MTTTDLSFGKIASTPSKSAWSQAYNAGGLFVILSLTLFDPKKEHESLGIIGKNFLNDLEAEFFPLEEKNTEGIGKALEKVFSEVPQSVDLTTVVAYHKDATLYLFLVGNGSIILKRRESLGTILAKSETPDRTLKSASGYLDPDDTVLLSTNSFKKAIDDVTIKNALSTADIDEAVETLTPQVQKSEDGSICALIFRHKEKVEESVGLATSENDAPEPFEQEEYTREQPEPSKEESTPSETKFTNSSPNSPFDSPPKAESQKFSLAQLLKSISLPATLSSLSHRRKVILSIAAVLVIALGMSVFFTLSTQAAKEREEIFNSVYPEALENYEKAEGLLELNKALAREELEKAETLLAKTEGKFPESSEEHEKTAALSVKVSQLLREVGEAKAVEATEITDDESLVLAALIPDSRISAIEDETSVYYLTDKGISSIRKGSKSEQALFENDNDWENPVSLGKFGSNFYVLDTEKGILKLVPSGTDYGVTSYFVDDISVKAAASMAIDTSVYVLYKNGDIKRFNRGKEEKFSVSGLENPLKNPVQITTSADIDSLYILDPATARIVRLRKDGSFEEEYQTSVLQDAKAIAISTDESKAYVLQNGKLYEINL